MGYELKLRVGRIGNASTIKRKTSFFNDITIDLSDCGKSNIAKLAEESFKKDACHKVYWYEGNETITEDMYGAEPSLVPLAKIIKALKKDIKTDDYRRFKWALATLEAVDKLDDGKPCKEFNAIFEGH
jgi:hypothetical protein